MPSVAFRTVIGRDERGAGRSVLGAVVRRRYVALTILVTLPQNLSWIHRRFIVVRYADRVVQDEEAALEASSEDKEVEDGGGDRRRLGASVYQSQPPGTRRRGKKPCPRGWLRNSLRRSGLPEDT